MKYMLSYVYLCNQISPGISVMLWLQAVSTIMTIFSTIMTIFSTIMTIFSTIMTIFSRILDVSRSYPISSEL